MVSGLLVLVGSFAIDFGAGYDRIGPRFFPWVVAAGLLVSGGTLARGVAKGRGAGPRVGTVGVPYRALGILALGMGLSVVLLERAGFILSSSLLFWLVARGFESAKPVRDAAVGLLLSIVVYFAFTRGLGLSLPPGILGSF